MVPNLTDADATRTITRALRLLAIMTVIATPIVGWKMGWQSGALLVAGAAISGAGLWKWLRLMTVVIARMDSSQGVDSEGASIPGQAKPLGNVLLGFFGTLGLMLVVLYGSLKLLDGSVYALFAGIAMGILALTIEALRLAKAWTV